jgi:hypothetical protein
MNPNAATALAADDVGRHANGDWNSFILYQAVGYKHRKVYEILRNLYVANETGARQFLKAPQVNAGHFVLCTRNAPIHGLPSWVPCHATSFAQSLQRDHHARY